MLGGRGAELGVLEAQAFDSEMGGLLAQEAQPWLRNDQVRKRPVPGDTGTPHTRIFLEETSLSPNLTGHKRGIPGNTLLVFWS